MNNIIKNIKNLSKERKEKLNQFKKFKKALERSLTMIVSLLPEIEKEVCLKFPVNRDYNLYGELNCFKIINSFADKIEYFVITENCFTGNIKINIVEYEFIESLSCESYRIGKNIFVEDKNTRKVRVNDENAKYYLDKMTILEDNLKKIINKYLEDL